MLRVKNPLGAMLVVVAAFIMIVAIMPENSMAQQEKLLAIKNDEDLTEFCVQLEIEVRKRVMGDAFYEEEERRKKAAESNSAEVESPKEVELDPDDVYKKAHKILKPFVGTRNLRALNVEIADSWEAARASIAKGECLKKYEAAVHITLLMSCYDTGIFKKTMREDALKYYNLCANNHAYWNELFVHIQTLDKFPKEENKQVSKFLDDDFITAFKSENQNERLNLIDGCCLPSGSYKAAYASFYNVALGKMEAELQHVRSNPDSIKDRHKRYLQNPCKEYYYRLKVYMVTLQQVSKLTEQGHVDFINSLSQEVQNAIFRYNYCKALVESETELEDHLRGLAWNVLYPEIDYNRVSCFELKEDK